MRPSLRRGLPSSFEGGSEGLFCDTGAQTHDGDDEDFAEDFALLCSGRFPAVFDEEAIEDFMESFYAEFKDYYAAA